MNKILIALCVSLLLLGGLVGLADAYPATATFYIDGIDLDLGDVYQDKSILIIIYAPVEEALAPPVDFDDFDPKADIYFEFTELTDPITITLAFVLEGDNQPNLTGVAKIEDTPIGDISASMLPDLDFDEEFSPVLFDDNDTVVLRISELEYITLGIIGIDLGEEFKVTVQIGREVIPEPSTLLLLGLGLFGLVGIVCRWRKKGKRTITFLLLAAIVGTTGVLWLCGAESVAAQDTFKITIIKKCREIWLSPEGEVVLEIEDVCDYGTVRTMKGDVEAVCPSGCQRIEDVPFSKNSALILKAEGGGFVGWRTDDNEVEGVLKVNDTTPEYFNLYAFFEVTKSGWPSYCEWIDPLNPGWWPSEEPWPPSWGSSMWCPIRDSLLKPGWWPPGESWPPPWWVPTAGASSGH